MPPASSFPIGCSWMWPFEVSAESADVGDGENCCTTTAGVSEDAGERCLHSECPFFPQLRGRQGERKQSGELPAPLT